MLEATPVVDETERHESGGLSVRHVTGPSSGYVNPVWGSGDAETVKASLLADIHGSNRLVGFKQDAYIEWVANPALRRLKLYFPEDYRALPGGNLPRKADFERSR
jgi:hypothetical protein